MLDREGNHTPTPSIDTDPIFVTIKMSKSNWIMGSQFPRRAKSHSYHRWGDAAALLRLVEQLRSRAADLISAATVPVLCCYEASYEDSGSTAGSSRRAPSSGDRPLQPAGEPTRQARADGSDRREGHDPCSDDLQQG